MKALLTLALMLVPLEPLWSASAASAGRAAEEPTSVKISGSTPNATSDTVIDHNTVWSGQPITLGGELVVRKNLSFTIDACDVLFDTAGPKGRMRCEAGTTIVIRDSYMHGRSEFDRAAGIVLGEKSDRLAVKISGTTFKYLGTWEQRPGSANSTPMILAQAIYTPESFFRGNSLICDSRPALPGPKPGTNWIWGFIGPHDAANATPAHGLNVQDCYFLKFNVAVDGNKHLSQSCVRESAEPFHTPPAYFLGEGNWFEDSTHKPYNLFGPSHHGLTKDNYFLNTAIDFTTTSVGKPSDNVFVNNIMVSAFSPYLGIKGPRASNGWGDRSVFLGNQMINHGRGLFCTGGKDWVVAGNKITSTGGAYGVGPRHTSATRNPERNTDCTSTTPRMAALSSVTCCRIAEPTPGEFASAQRPCGLRHTGKTR